MKKPKPNKSKISKNNSTHFEFFDDCPMCQALKQGKDPFLKQDSEMVMRPATKDDLYYDALDAIEQEEYNIARNLLQQARKIDPDYVQTYTGFVYLYMATKQKKMAHENVIISFEKTLKHFPKWPRRMPWGDLDNRAYLRAIQYRADLFADTGEIEKALEFYKLILRLNPGDNQGVRYLIAGIYAGISGDDVNRMFEEGDRRQNWSRLEKLVNDQNKKHHFWKKPKNP